ncbi:MAG: peptidase M15D vanX D-ala-D-ala dipeptidase [Chitinivibrionales bacterium]|nr:peptidase M15D vanX D-ala-D-ala dipeptidase [Chitinivibrionales bacterium]
MHKTAAPFILYAFISSVSTLAAEPAPHPLSITPDSASALEQRLSAEGFVDVRAVDSTIRVDLKYARADNFMKANVYGAFSKCYLRREAAEKLARANAHLRTLRPGWSLLVADGLRPRRVQRRMWEIVQGTPMQRYVANPRWGSMHNYGCAVDLTIADSSGNRLDMGCPIDHFGPLSQPRLEQQYLREGKLTEEQIANRRLLRTVMTEAGFQPLAIEWWHFNAFDKKTVRERYSIVE